MAITALPTLDRTSVTFRTDADTFFGTQLPLFSVQAEAARVEINTNQSSVATNAGIASSAASIATSAVAALNVPIWVSGATYAIGDTRWSPTDRRVYRRITAGAGTTDPSADPTNWGIIGVEPLVSIVTGTTQTAISNVHYVLTNVALTTLTLPANPSPSDVVLVTIANGLYGGTILSDVVFTSFSSSSFTTNSPALPGPYSPDTRIHHHRDGLRFVAGHHEPVVRA